MSDSLKNDLLFALNYNLKEGFSCLDDALDIYDGNEILEAWKAYFEDIGKPVDRYSTSKAKNLLGII